MGCSFWLFYPRVVDCSWTFSPRPPPSRSRHLKRLLSRLLIVYPHSHPFCVAAILWLPLYRFPWKCGPRGTNNRRVRRGCCTQTIITCTYIQDYFVSIRVKLSSVLFLFNWNEDKKANDATTIILSASENAMYSVNLYTLLFVSSAFLNLKYISICSRPRHSPSLRPS